MVLDCPIEPGERPPLEEFLAALRRFQDLVRRNADGKAAVRTGGADDVERLRASTQGNVERLHRLAELK